MFFAFTFEAYLNHVGAEEIQFWDEIERISYQKKLTVLSRQLGFAKDLSKPPLQIILELFKFRDALAHGRTETTTVKVTGSAPPPHDAVCYLLPAEKLTPEVVRRYHDEVQAAVEFINSARPKPDRLVWDQGSRSSVTSYTK